MGGDISVSLGEIVLETGWLGYKRVNTTSVEKEVKEGTN